MSGMFRHGEEAKYGKGYVLGGGEASLGSADISAFSANKLPALAQQIQNNLSSFAGEGREQALQQKAMQRFTRELFPVYSAAGVLSPQAETEATQGLRTTLGGGQFDREKQRVQLQQQAIKGLAVLRAMPAEMRTRLIAALMSGKMAQPSSGGFNIAGYGVNW